MRENQNKISLLSKTILALLVLTTPCFADRIPGTKVSLDPPRGFTSTTQFPGFMMQSTGASIMVTELPAPVSELTKGLTKQNLATRGMTLLDTSDAQTGSGNAATLLYVSQNTNGVDYLKWMLVFGNPDESVMILATFPQQYNSLLSERLKKSILKATWDATIEVAPADGMTFSIEEKGDLKIANRIGNNLILTRSGVFPLKEKDDPSIAVGASMMESDQVTGSNAAFAKARINQIQALPNPKIISERSELIDGLEAYLIEAEGKDADTGNEIYVMQCVIYGPKGYYLFQAFVRKTEQRDYLQTFTAILRSFRRI